MKITDLSGKKICILGFGREGKAMLNALEMNGVRADITIADAGSVIGCAQCTLQTGDDYLSDLNRFDVIIKSPGIPPKPELEALQSKITSSTQIFFDSIQESGATVIGVTGSKGKSTTASLIYEILRAALHLFALSDSRRALSRGERVSLIGNIGEPAISHLDEAKAGKIFVLEMSSYQLKELTVSPTIAVVTSFFPEHLDYHGSLKAYKEAKKHIARFQKPQDFIFFNATSDGAREIAMESKGTRIPFSADDCPVPIEETHLLGEHNRSNIAAAYKIGQHLQIAEKTMQQAIKDFRGLPHRLQSLGVHHGIEWIDDAISTTPESTIAALDALGDRVATIILGGQDRGNDFSQLAHRIKNSSVKIAILFPGSGPRIKEALEAVGFSAKIFDASSMEGAVKFSKENTNQRINESTSYRPIVLLSTASPSYGMFKNFEEKGDAFARSVKPNML